MSRFEDGDLPPELSDVADRLRSLRYEASALELDQAKGRILKRAGGQRAARGGAMRKRTFLTAVIMFAAIGTGSAAALAVSGVIHSFPLIGSTHASRPATSRPNASLAQYGTRPTRTRVFCRPTVVRSGRTTRCTATVTDVTTPTGTVTFQAAGQTRTCQLVRLTRSSSRCSVTFRAPTVGRRKSRRVIVRARYSGDATHSPSSGTGRFVVRKSRFARARV